MAERPPPPSDTSSLDNLEGGGPPRSSYFKAAEQDRSILGQRPRMREFYLQDVRSALCCGVKSSTSISSSSSNSSISSSSSNSSSSNDSKRDRNLRIAQWNVNVLHGYDFKSPVAARALAEAVRGLDADVVLIQEGGVQLFSEADCIGTVFEGLNSADRVSEFHSILSGEFGFQLVFAGGVPNPSMIAIRNGLRIIDTQDAFCIDKDHAHYATMKNDHCETRSARFVSVAIPIEEDDPSSFVPVSFCLTHLHHTEKNARGIRLAEVSAILRNKPQVVCGKSPITVIASDFNQSRQRDYIGREWALISETLERICEPTSDGVAEELEKHGFVATYDLIPVENKPIFTHWTSTIVDFGYIHSPSPGDFTVASVQVIPNELSDHLPIIHNIIIHC